MKEPRKTELPIALLLLFLLVCSLGEARGQDSLSVAPVGKVSAWDTPNDGGGSITVTWESSPDEAKGKVTGYRVLRSQVGGRFQLQGEVGSGVTKYVDEDTQDGREYIYAIQVLGKGGSSPLTKSSPASSWGQWYNTQRTNMLLVLLIISAGILLYIRKAKAGGKLFIRKIAGLDAVDEAVGRATEMGKPVLFIPGIMDMDDIQTIAGITILSRVARKTADYDTSLRVPVCRSVVMSVAQEVVKEAYLDAGRPDAYDADKINYLTDDQFGYAAGVDGIMLREKPAAIFLMGHFFAESLILAETGFSIGAIQIAGTAEISQLPFFITACDYTLIGEELFAASAYLSGEPRLLGSLKGQDLGKAIFMAIIIVGVVLESLGFHFLTKLVTTG